MAGVQIDGVNNKIDFDDDQDTSISANTDDTLVIEAGGVNIASITAGEFAINEGSADIDFRVESNGNANMLFVSGGNDCVGIGAEGDLGLLHIKVADSGASVNAAGNEFVIEDGTSGANVGISILSATDGEGRIVFGDSGDNDIGQIRYDHADNKMHFVQNNASQFTISGSTAVTTLAIVDDEIASGGETAPDVGTGGLTLNQGASDNNILTFKSSDVAHGFTALQETDTYGTFGKGSATDGGLTLQGFHEGQGFGVQIIAHCKSAGYTASNTAGYGHLDLIARGTNGSTSDAALEDNENCMSVRNGGNVKFIVKGNGEIYSDVTANTFDTYEDAQLVRAFDLSKGEKAKGLINSKFDKYIKYNHETLADADLVGREEDGTPNHFVNVTGMQRLHNGAIWQQYEKHQRLAEAVYEMAKEALGEDKADAILEKHDIKLLN